MITESRTFALTPGQQALFVGWERELRELHEKVQAAKNVAVSVELSRHLDLAEVQGCSISIGPDGITVTPPVERSLKLEPSDPAEAAG